VKRFLRNNALGIVLVVTFLVIWLVGQTVAGLQVYNQQRLDAGLATIGWARYLTTSHFGEDPLLHRDDPDAPWPVRRGGWVLAVYRRSLSLAFLALFLASVALHAASGSRAYNAEQSMSGGTDHTTGWSYLTRSQFWFESLQNWQSEFLAVAAIVLLSIVLRQHGSPESKPVHAPYHEIPS
jgi:Domain of unknown function (DUF6766)